MQLDNKRIVVCVLVDVCMSVSFVTEEEHRKVAKTF